MTRAWSAALRGRLHDSLSYHPLGLPTLLAACSLALRPSLDGQDLPAWTRSKGFLAVLAIGWLGIWVARLAVARGTRGGARPG